MATPASNSTPTTTVDPLVAGTGRYLIAGEKWGGALGTGVTLTYSFPTAGARHITPYSAYPNAGEWLGLVPLTTAEKTAVRSALSAWSVVSGLRFVEVADTASTVGELRFASTSYDTAQEFAHAYYPSSDPSAGDVWMSTDNFNPAGGAVTRGSNDYHTILHEIGHALGLKHAFEAPNATPAGRDNYFYSVMSYSARVTGDSGEATFYPTTPMYDDLVAIQALYGRNMSHNASNTTYKFIEGQRYFQTIDDAGGTDTIQYAGLLASFINLNTGKFSSLSAPIRFDNGSTRATVAIGPNSVIENAIGGSGNDTIIGNSAANILNGANGADTLNGGAGVDRLIGYNGNDKLYGLSGSDILFGGNGSDAFYFTTGIRAGGDVDRITDFSSVADTIYLSKSIFAALVRGTLTGAAFRIGPAAADTSDRIIYDKAAGALLYDADGTGAAAQVQFASLKAGLMLTAADFIIV